MPNLESLPCLSCLELDLLLLDDLHTLAHGLHVERNELVVALRERLEESLVQALGAHNGANLEQTAQNDHVEHLGVLHLGSLVRSINLIDRDVLAGRRIDDTVPS